MAIQTRSNLNNTPFTRLSDPADILHDATILQDAGETIPLAPFTLMAKVAASQKWVPFTDETATNGSAHPQGIYMGSSIPAADIVAGDVVDNQILEANAHFDQNQLVIRNSKILATVITVGTTDLRTVRDHLITRGLVPVDTIDITGFENA